MATIQEIERAIGNLSSRELEELRTWMDTAYPEPIDARLEADLAAGRIDLRIDRALSAHKAGNARPL